MFTAGEIFDIAVRIEENGERYYRKAATQVRDAAFKEILNWLADEEQNHREWFRDKKVSLEEEGEEALAQKMGGAILQSAMGEHVFSLDEVDPVDLPDEAALIETAIGMEEDSVTFYELLRSFVEDEQVVEHIESIIAEEQKHIEALQDLKEAVQERLEEKL